MRNKLVKVLTATLISATMLTGLSTINTEAATKVYLNKKSVTLTQGKTTTLKVKGISKNTKVKYSSNKKSVATVSSKGKITAKKKGVAIISAKFTVKSNKKSVTKVLKCKVTVNAKRVQATKTPKPTSTPRPTATPTVRPTNTVAPTATPTAVPTSTPTPEPTVEVIPTTIPVEVVTSETPVATVAPTATSTPAPTATATPTVAPTEVPVHIHNYNARYEVVKESTCTEDGLIRMYCECGEVYERVICADHHNVSFVSGSWKKTSPTETTDGYFGIHCNDCGEDVTFSERTTFPALTDENYPLEGWVYEKHDYDYDSLYYMTNHKVDRRHADPYIVVTDYIGTAEHPALKDSYVIDGVKYDVEIQGKLNITSPTVQSLKLSGVTWVNPDKTVILAKKISYYGLGGTALITD